MRRVDIVFAYRVTARLENVEESWNYKVVREESGKMGKIWEP